MCPSIILYESFNRISEWFLVVSWCIRGFRRGFLRGICDSRLYSSCINILKSFKFKNRWEVGIWRCSHDRMILERVIKGEMILVCYGTHGLAFFKAKIAIIVRFKRMVCLLMVWVLMLCVLMLCGWVVLSCIVVARAS
uniref:Transmembrane protein n=1 Tax=Lepeophtheirus salmonis TaxID=72036 RepID=A0A0K2TCR0_LEPSM